MATICLSVSYVNVIANYNVFYFLYIGLLHSGVDKQGEGAYAPPVTNMHIFLKQDSAFSSDMNATDDIDIAILSVRLSVNDTPELYQNS